MTMKIKTVLAAFLAVTVAAVGWCHADDANPAAGSAAAEKAETATATDLQINRTPGPWRHASTKPLEIVPDPLRQHPDGVVVVPEKLQLFQRKVTVNPAAESLTLAFEFYLEGGNLAGGLITERPGENFRKAYVFGVDAAGNVQLGIRDGDIGPWEWRSEIKVTLQKAKWAKLTFIWYRDGTLQVALDDDLLLEEEDNRLSLEEVGSVFFQTNLPGNKYLTHATMTGLQEPPAPK